MKKCKRKQTSVRAKVPKLLALQWFVEKQHPYANCMRLSQRVMNCALTRPQLCLSSLYTLMRAQAMALVAKGSRPHPMP
jgi:hypothetical protein